MVSYKHPKPLIKSFRLQPLDSRDLEHAVRYRGTHHMAKEINWFKEMAIMTAAQSFNEHFLRDNQENFLTKLSELRYVNGYNDVDDADFAEIQQLWHRLVLDLVDDFNDVDIYDYDDNVYVMEIHVRKFTDQYIDLDRILHERAERRYD